MNDVVSQNENDGNNTITHVIYGLYAASLITFVTGIAAIIINYVKKEDVAGTYLESHFNWQIRTFWVSLALMILGFVTSFILIGWFILAANYVWLIYRITKGWLKLSERKPVY